MESVQPAMIARALLGGLLMGLANLVPGVSGGTMLLAAGVYTLFIDALADISSLHFRKGSLLILFLVAGTAAVSILLLAGPVKSLVIHHRWIAYSLFIGLSLGGVPILFRMIGSDGKRPILPLLAGFLAMAILAWFQQYGDNINSGTEQRLMMLFVAGAAGASAMILPGISGGYLLLLLGQYLPILRGIDELKQALGSLDFAALGAIMLSLVIPLGLGILAGAALISNLLRFLLARYRKQTLGVLLGILLGAVVGLWPFQEAIKPEPGDLYKGQVLNRELIEDLKADEYPTEIRTPAAGEAVAALGIALGGFFFTALISGLDRRKNGASKR